MLALYDRAMRELNLELYHYILLLLDAMIGWRQDMASDCCETRATV